MKCSLRPQPELWWGDSGSTMAYHFYYSIIPHCSCCILEVFFQFITFRICEAAKIHSLLEQELAHAVNASSHALNKTHPKFPEVSGNHVVLYPVNIGVQLSSPTLTWFDVLLLIFLSPPLPPPILEKNICLHTINTFWVSLICLHVVHITLITFCPYICPNVF